MEKLDGDDDRLKNPYTGQYALRDIVQFVRLNDYFDMQNGYCNNPSAFNKAVLGEIPDQLIGYFCSKGIIPN